MKRTVTIVADDGDVKLEVKIKANFSYLDAFDKRHAATSKINKITDEVILAAFEPRYHLRNVRVK